jgi:hypothetical protein
VYAKLAQIVPGLHERLETLDPSAIIDLSTLVSFRRSSSSFILLSFKATEGCVECKIR